MTIIIRRAHNGIAPFNGAVSVRFIAERIGHNFVLNSHTLDPDSIQLTFNPNFNAPWENSNLAGSIEFDVGVREDQLGVVKFTWVSGVTGEALLKIENTFMIEEEGPQSQSEHGSQNAQSTTTFFEMTESDYLQFFTGTDLKLLFEKANIKGNLSSFFLFFLDDKF